VLHEACRVFRRGFTDPLGRPQWRRSIEQAISPDPVGSSYLRWVVEKYEVGNLRQTLWLRMRVADPTIRRVHRSGKRNLPDAVKAKRKAACLELLTLDCTHCMFMASVVWIDQKKGWTTPEGEWVYAGLDEYTSKDFPIPHDATNKRHLCFYIAVNAYLGPVGIYFVTGTHGEKNGFKVRITLGLACHILGCITPSYGSYLQARAATCAAPSVTTKGYHCSASAVHTTLEQMPACQIQCLLLSAWPQLFRACCCMRALFQPP
jgi:hypothetical protein